MSLRLCRTSFNKYCATQGHTGMGQAFTFEHAVVVEYYGSQNGTPGCKIGEVRDTKVH